MSLKHKLCMRETEREREINSKAYIDSYVFRLVLSKILRSEFRVR